MTILFMYYGAMIAGYYLASRLRDIKEQFNSIDKIFNVLIIFLILLMGIRMGSDQRVIENLGKIGLYSLVVTVIVIIGSVLFVSVSRRLLRLDKEANLIKKKLGILEQLEGEYTDEAIAKKPPLNVKITDTLKSNDIFRPIEDSLAIEGGTYHKDDSVSKTNLITTIMVVVPLTIGLVIGYKVIMPNEMDIDLLNSLTGNLLILGVTLLLFAIGFSMGLSGNILASVKKIGVKFLIFPISAILGSLFGGIICGVILPISIPEGLAISAGFGWYTMAPTVITEAGHTYAGAISFMHNVIREMGGIVLIPFLVNKVGYIEVTALPGVCAMDIGMPIIEKCTKEEMVAYSFGMGVVMSMVVPLLVPIFINL